MQCNTTFNWNPSCVVISLHVKRKWCSKWASFISLLIQALFYLYQFLLQDEDVAHIWWRRNPASQHHDRTGFHFLKLNLASTQRHGGDFWILSRRKSVLFFNSPEISALLFPFGFRHFFPPLKSRIRRCWHAWAPSAFAQKWERAAGQEASCFLGNCSLATTAPQSDDLSALELSLTEGVEL